MGGLVLQTGIRRSGSRLLGFGAALPDAVVAGAAMGAPFGKSAEWVRTRTGIDTVHRMAAADELAVLGTRAAQDALLAAGVAHSDVDLVLTVSCSTGQGLALEPALARDLAPRAARHHINAACSGFCYALGAADTLIRTGSARHVLIVAAERMTGMIDPADLDTSVIFGDGAGAAVVGPAAAGTVGIGPMVAGSDGEQRGLIACDAGGVMRMAGRQVFRWALEAVPPIAREACARAGVEPGDIAVFVPHQANLRIIRAVVGALGLEHAVVATDVTNSGNTSGASIPIALRRLVDQGRTRAGQFALLVGFGAGLTYAAQVVKLP